MITAGGTFLVCWCSAMTGGCSSNQDFVVQVAEIVVQGVKQGQTWTCVAYHACNIQVPREGNLAAGDVVQIISAEDGSVCGRAEQIDSGAFSRGTRVLGRVATLSDGGQAIQFPMGEPMVPGHYQVCYCQQLGSCDDDLDYFQRAGAITISGIRGGIDARFVCYVRDKCTLLLKGTDLAPEDSIILSEPRNSCGMKGAKVDDSFSAQGFQLSDGSKAFIGEHQSTSDGGVESWEYDLGTAKIAGRYRICYCAAHMEASQGCRARQFYAQDGGEVYVRGVRFITERQCYQGEECPITLRSYTFDIRDRLLIMNASGTCGDAGAELPWWMYPTSPENIVKDTVLRDLVVANWVLTQVGEPGIFRLCYCAYVHGADECMIQGSPGDPAQPNLARFSHNAGTLRVAGMIGTVREVTLDDYGGVMPLPASPMAASVEVEALNPGGYITCVATGAPAPPGFLPRRSDLQNCSLNAWELDDRQRLFPRCWGTGTTVQAAATGWAQVHIPLTLPQGATSYATEVHVWCYSSKMCSNDRCVLPASSEGSLVRLTGGLQSTNFKWTGTVSTEFPLNVRLTSSYDVGDAWPSIKVIKEGEDCNIATLRKDRISGITCPDYAAGKCNPRPQARYSAGSWGSLRELTWHNLKIKRAGEYGICYSDRFYDQVTMAWFQIGTVEVIGPQDVNQGSYWGNPGLPFNLTVRGTGLTLTDRLRIVPQFSDCTAVMNGSMAGQFDWRSGMPTFSNATYQTWQETRIQEAGIYELCWCSGTSSACIDPWDFTVRLGRLDVITKRDCLMSDWWVVKGCSRKCGGGVQQLRRAIQKEAQGGGIPCPSTDGLYTTVECNMDPCPLVRLDYAQTEPAQLYTMAPFAVKITGHWMDPDEDKILLVAEKDTCGQTQDHFGGAACWQEGSNGDLLVCGDGLKSIRVKTPGRYKICVCDASGSYTRSWDGKRNLTAGSSVAEGLPGQGCDSPSHFTLHTSIDYVIQVDPAPVAAAQTPSDDGPSFWLIAVLVAIAAGIVAACIGCYLRRRWRHQTEEATKAAEDDLNVALEQGKATSYQEQAPPLIGPNGQVDMQALAWYEMAWQQAGHPPGHATQALTSHLALTDSAPLVQNQAFIAPSPPPAALQPLALAPPPPNTPPHLPLSLPLGASPRGASPRGVGASPRSASPRLSRLNLTGDKSPRGTALVGRRSSMERGKTFADFVQEAELRPTTPTKKNFADMDLTPLPTPTQTPRVMGGDATPRSLTPRENEASTPLALEDGSAAWPPNNAEQRPVSGNSDMRPISRSSAFTSDGRPSTGGSEPPRPTTAESGPREAATADAGAASVDAPAAGPAPRLKLPQSSQPATNSRLPGIEERPNSAHSSASSAGRASLALSDSTDGGAADPAGRSRRSGAAGRLTQSVLKAHDSAMSGAPAGEADAELGATPRTEASNRTPRALASFLSGGIGKMLGRGKAEDAAEGESTTPRGGRGRWFGGGGSKASRSPAAEAEPTPPPRIEAARPATPSTEPAPLPKVETQEAEKVAQKKAEEEARQKEEEDARQKAAEEARRKAEEEARHKAEEEARQKAEEEARQKLEEEARRKVEEESRRKAEEEASRKVEEEARQKAEEEARRKVEEEARRKAEAEAKQKAEEEERRRADEEARLKAEEEAKRKAEEEARFRAEEDARRKAEEEAAPTHSEGEWPASPEKPPHLRLPIGQAPPSPTLYRPNNRKFPGMPDSPGNPDPTAGVEGPPAPPPPPGGAPPQATGNGLVSAAELERGEGGRLKMHGSLRDWANSRQPASEAGSRGMDSGRASEVEPEGDSSAAAIEKAPPPPPGKPPRGSLGPGAKLPGPGFGLTVETDLEDTINSTASSMSSGSPSGAPRRGFSLGGLAASGSSVRTMAKPPSPAAKLKVKRTNIATEGAQAGLPGAPTGKRLGPTVNSPDGAPPPPPMPMPKASVAGSPKAGSPLNAWGRMP